MASHSGRRHPGPPAGEWNQPSGRCRARRAPSPSGGRACRRGRHKPHRRRRGRRRGRHLDPPGPRRGNLRHGRPHAHRAGRTRHRRSRMVPAAGRHGGNPDRWHQAANHWDKLSSRTQRPTRAAPGRGAAAPRRRRHRRRPRTGRRIRYRHHARRRAAAPQHPGPRRTRTHPPARPSAAAQTGPVGNLAKRESQVLTLLADGLSNRRIAQDLFISERRSACTSPTSWPSSASSTAPKPPRPPGGSASRHSSRESSILALTFVQDG